MGGNLALNFGLKHPEICSSLVVAGCGAGSTNRKQFEQDVKTIADRLEKEGMPKVAEFYGVGPTRVQFRRKDSRGCREFLEQFKGHDAIGSALTFRGVQLRRPSIFALEEKLKGSRFPRSSLSGTRMNRVLSLPFL